MNNDLSYSKYDLHVLSNTRSGTKQPNQSDHFREDTSDRAVLHGLCELLKIHLLFVFTYSTLRPQNGYSLLVILIVVIDDRDSLVLLGSLHLPVLLGASRLLRWRTSILTIVRITRFFGIIFGAFLLKVIFLFLFLVIFTVLGLGALCLLLWCCPLVRRARS